MNTTVVIILGLIGFYFVIMEVLRQYALHKTKQKVIRVTAMIEGAVKSYPEDQNYQNWLEINPLGVFQGIVAKFPLPRKKKELAEAIRLLWIACDSIEQVIHIDRTMTSFALLGSGEDLIERLDRSKGLVRLVDQCFSDIRKRLEQ